MEQLSAKILDQVLPTWKNCTIGFGQLEGENLAEAWDIFQEILRKCPHHKLTRWMQVHTFYNGLRNATRIVIDASARGALMKKTMDQAYEILEDAATNTNQWPRDKITPVKAIGRTDNGVLNNLVTHVAQLTKQLTRQQGAAYSIQTNPWELCEFYGDSTTAKNASRETKQQSMLSMCRGLIRVSHSNRVNMGATTIRTKIKAKGGVILRIVKTVRVMDGKTIRTTCHQPE